MGAFMIIIRLVVILAAVLFMALPFLMEYYTFRADSKDGVSHKRFRIVIYTAIYVVAVTVALFLLKELLLWLESLSLIKWIASNVALNQRIPYFGKVAVAVLVNIAIGFGYVFFSKFVRIGMGKKEKSKPKNEDEKSDKKQKLGTKIINFFYAEAEAWSLVGRIIKWLSILLSAIYALFFIFYQTPAMFDWSWIPYEFISMCFSAGYMYPSLTLLALWEAYFFLCGIQNYDEECPELLPDATVAIKEVEVDLKAIDDEVRKQFGEFYSCDIELSEIIKDEVTSTSHNPITEYIAQAVENDKRNPQIRRDAYLTCLDKIIEGNKGVLINGNFFSEFSIYFLRYISATIARGDNVIFVCNTDAQINSVYDYLIEGLSENASLYCKDFQKDEANFDDPIWRVVKVSGEHSDIEEASVDGSNILVTTLGYLASAHFETEHGMFTSLVDTVVFVDTLNTVNTFGRQLSIINTHLKHITKKISLAAKNGRLSDEFRQRYLSREIRYICFDDTRVPGLDKALKNKLAVDFDTVDSMSYNKGTIVRCYNYEGRADGNGRRIRPNLMKTQEEIGILMVMAMTCLEKGAKNVTVFADDVIPYENIAETIAANRAQISVNVDGNRLLVNKRFYNPDEYSVVIAMDSGENLPATLRRYISTVSDKPALVIVFSKPYMLRDYYADKIGSVWRNNQIERIPVEEGTQKDVAQQILIKAGAEGISKKKIFELAKGVKQFEEYAEKEDLNSILREVLRVYGVMREDSIDLFKTFEYKSSQGFDENGVYNSEVRIILRRRGNLFDRINGRNIVTMIAGDSEIPLPVPRSRLTQRYIAGQNLVYNGKIFYINKIDVEKGILYTKLASGGKNNEVYQYVQNREYRVELKGEQVETVLPTQHVVLNRTNEKASVKDVYISVFRAPTEVVTAGYFELDPHTLASNCVSNEYHVINDKGRDSLAKQTYRRYGMISEPFYSSDSLISAGCPGATEKGALMMSVRICGEFGGDIDKTMNLAAVMLNELLHSMFPSVADSVVVCPVLHGELADDDAKAILKTQPKLVINGKSEQISDTDFNLVIIEDSSTELGVISVLRTAGDDVLYTLFEPIFNYLEWYKAKEKSDYLHFGLGHEPTCFDFETLHGLAKLLGDDKHDLKVIDLESVVEYDTCDFCKKRCVKGDGMVELEDGRRMCKACAGKLVGNNKKVLKAHLERAKMFLESTYGIELDDDYEFCFESTVKIANTLKQNRELVKRGADVPLKSYVDNKKVYVEYELPSVNLSELLVRELTYVWQLKHLPELDEKLAEGQIALVAVQYLRFLNQDTLASARTMYYESTDSVSGEGYRKLVKALLENTQFNNNPFRYLLEMSGEIVESRVTPPSPRIVGDGAYGLPYTPTTVDRATDGSVQFFHYSRLTETCQRAYDDLLEAIKNHEAALTIDGCSFDDVCKVSSAIRYDHPELFWYKNFSMGGSTVEPIYGASAEEVAVLQRRMDEVIPKYLEGIDDTMSAYDVILRVYTKIISTVDYDTIALDKQNEEGGPAEDKIDYLRTICGVFLNGKAVCEGYARAVQYLLQRCGIECAEVVGHIVKETGELGYAHAWNIVKVDGDYYYLDATWDDSSNTVQTVKSNDIGFDYFCITTEEISRTRNLDLCPTDVPVCSAVRCNYYYHNNCVLDTYNLNKLKGIAQTAAANKSKSFTFKCANKNLYEQCKEQLFAQESDGYELLKAAAKADKQIRSDGYSYSYDKNIFTITIKFKYK